MLCVREKEGLSMMEVAARFDVDMASQKLSLSCATVAILHGR